MRRSQVGLKARRGNYLGEISGLISAIKLITDSVPGGLAELGTGPFYVVFIHPTANLVHEFEFSDAALTEFAHHQVEPQTDVFLQAELSVQRF